MSKRNSYVEKLKDPRWQKLRLQCFERDQFTCQVCGDKDNSLQVHHKGYHGEPWETPIGMLQTLCESCHNYRSRIDKELCDSVRLIYDEFFFDEYGEPSCTDIHVDVLFSGICGLIQSAILCVLHDGSFQLSGRTRDHVAGMLCAAKNTVEESSRTFFRMMEVEKNRQLNSDKEPNGLNQSDDQSTTCVPSQGEQH